MRSHEHYSEVTEHIPALGDFATILTAPDVAHAD